MSNDFPKIGINTEDLVAAVEALIEEARQEMQAGNEDFGAVNWGDVGVMDVEYRLSMLRPGDGPWCHVMLEEASSTCELPSWIAGRLDSEKFPKTVIECEW